MRLRYSWTINGILPSSQALPGRVCGRGRFFGRYGSAGNKRLKPGESAVWDEVLFLRETSQPGEDEFLFSTPGDFCIQAEVKWVDARGGGRTACRSNEVQVHVSEAGPDERAAIPLITAEAVVRSVGNARRLSDEAVSTLDELVTKYPRCAYADYANFRLGVSFSARGNGASGKPDPRAVSEEARRHLAAVTRRMPALRLRAAQRELKIILNYPDLIDRARYLQLKADFKIDAPLSDRYPLGWFPREFRVLDVRYSDDERLDQEVEYRYGNGVTYGDVLKSLSEQTGVPLDTGERKKKGKIGPSLVEKSTLRKWMGRQDDLFRYWERRGDGYFLVIEPIPEVTEAEY